MSPEPAAVRAVVDRLDHALDVLAALRHDVACLGDVFTGEDLAEWEEALHCAQMDVGTVVHPLVSAAILAGLWPAGGEEMTQEEDRVRRIAAVAAAQMRAEGLVASHLMAPDEWYERVARAIALTVCAALEEIGAHAPHVEGDSP